MATATGSTSVLPPLTGRVNAPGDKHRAPSLSQPATHHGGATTLPPLGPSATAPTSGEAEGVAVPAPPKGMPHRLSLASRRSITSADGEAPVPPSGDPAVLPRQKCPAYMALFEDAMDQLGILGSVLPPAAGRVPGGLVRDADDDGDHSGAAHDDEVRKR